MAFCPIYLIGSVNEIYYYYAIDCDAPENGGTVSSDRLLTCGCSNNPDCSGGLMPSAPDPSVGIELDRPDGMEIQGLPPEVLEVARKLSVPTAVVSRSLNREGLKRRLPVSADFALPSAVVDPAFAREKAYHVVQIDGAPRYLRILSATIPPRPGPEGVRSSALPNPLPSMKLHVGQECELPPGVTPIPMTLVEPRAAGSCVVKVRRGQPSADAAIFHAVLLK